MLIKNGGAALYSLPRRVSFWNILHTSAVDFPILIQIFKLAYCFDCLSKSNVLPHTRARNYTSRVSE